MQQTVQNMLDALGNILQGKDNQLKLALSCILAEGHLLVEDLPGMGKTTLATALAKTLGLDYSRVQFTSDMLPADIIGATIFEKDSASFQFHPGPVFTQVLLADEINRTTPKTQSALLEAMAEGQVSVEGETHQLPEPFLSLQHRILWRNLVRFHCLSRNWTDFLSALSWVILIKVQSARY